MTRMYNPPHPGEVLLEYFGDMSASTVAVKLGVHRATLRRLVSGTSRVSVEMADHLGRMFGTGPEIWSGMQLQYDLYMTGSNEPLQS